MPKKLNIKPSFLKAQVFADVHNRISLDPRFLAVVSKKLPEALCTWAIMEMGTRWLQYWNEALRDFHVKCTRIVAETNRDIGEVAEETLFEIPLYLSKKRPAFTGQIFDLYLMAAEYEQVLSVVKSAKRGVLGDVEFRLNLREKLVRFSSDENLEPVPEKDLDKILKRYDRHTTPSRIAQDYIGCKRSLNGATVKKLLVIARDPKRMSRSFSKYLKTAYMPKDFDISKSILPPKI